MYWGNARTTRLEHGLEVPSDGGETTLEPLSQAGSGFNPQARTESR
eukprot:COSAG02_NODE_2961_length_7649_cov_39.990066_4_plen_46_part_00